jgi:hypothetical protein
LIFVFVLGASQQTTAIYNKKNNLQREQQKQQHTQQSSGWGVVIIGSLLGLLLFLGALCFCAWRSVTTINNNLQQSAPGNIKLQ